MKLQTLLLVGLSLILSACGFHLRNSADLPFATLSIAMPESSDLRANLARNIEASTQTRIVANAKEADATLGIIENTQTKSILSLNSAGRVREYQLTRTLGFRVYDKTGHDLIPASRIVVQRDYTFDDDQLAAKQAEEALLWRDMQNDIVQQLLRRLSASKPQTAAPSEN